MVEQQVVPKAKAQSQTRLLFVQALLFLTTCLTTTVAGMRAMANFRMGIEPLTTAEDVFPFGWIWAHRADVLSGAPFSATLLGILLAHEFGHYFAARYFRVKATLPFVLPGPSITGTLGAVIRLKGVIRSSKALMVIAASGPIAGFVVAIGTTTLGLVLSVPTSTKPMWLVHLNEPPLILLLRGLLGHGFGVVRQGPLLWHPVLLASWFGLLITSLNLVPAGQLDGGHILFSVSPRAHKVATNVCTIGLAIMGVFVWSPWLLWMGLLLVPAMRRPYVVNRRSGFVFVHPTYDRRAATGRGYKWLVPVCLLVALLCLFPRPFDHAGLIETIKYLKNGN